MGFNNEFEYLQKTICCVKTSLLFDHLILVNISFSQYFMRFMYHLIAILHLMLGLLFLDISKAFDGVWHDGLIYKMKHLGITGPLLKLV